jgi:hypothetical protein
LKKKIKPGLWVLAYDIHYPKVHWKTFNAMLDFINKNKSKIVGFGFGGDQFDNAEISHHNKRRIIFREVGSYKRNTVGFDKCILTPIERALPRGVERHWIQGNHEHWERQLVEESPELEGSIEHDILLNLEERGWDVHATGTGFSIGKLGAVHGEALRGTHHAKYAVETYAQSVVYGHFHTNQCHTKILPQSKDEKWCAWALPCMCETNPVYLRNGPHAWVNGFGIVEVRADGTFNLYPVVVSDGQFSFGGVTYGKK